jgi:hypothetical protein
MESHAGTAQLSGRDKEIWCGIPESYCTRFFAYKNLHVLRGRNKEG